MKWWQFFFLMAGIYIAPHMDSGLSVVFGFVMLAAGILAAMVLDD